MSTSPPDDPIGQLVVHIVSPVLVRLEGELDFASAQHLEAPFQVIVENGSDGLDLDMADVTFCDSSGIRAVLNAHRRLAAQHRHLRIVNPSEQVARLLELTGLNELST